MKSASNEQPIRERPGWILPVAVFAITAALSGAVLLYYFAPPASVLLEERSAPTERTDRVSLVVGGVSFSIPSNYIRYKSARRGGTFSQVALFAALPDFRGYSDQDAAIFLGNAEDSPIVHILLHVQEMKLSEKDRLERVYLGYVADPKGAAGPYGLAQYHFRNDSGYRGEDLFVGRVGTALVLLRCERLTDAVPSPGCLRDTHLSRHASVSYRFKLAQLSRWREIATGVDSLMHAFMRGK